MTASNLKLIARNFWKNRLFSIINILGLSIGISCAIIIFLFVEFELSFDKFHKNGDRIYRIVKDVYHSTTINREGSASYMLSGAMRMEFPDYIFTGFFNNPEKDVIVDGVVYAEKNILMVDSAYFKIFEYNWIVGSPDLIQDQGNIALTESIAKKYFNGENPLGKTVKFSSGEVFHVVGILKDPPLNSSQPYSMIVSLEVLGDKYLGINIKRWGTDISGFGSFVKINANTDPENLGKDITNRVRDKYLNESQKEQRFVYKLQNIRQIHLQPEYESVDNTYTISKQRLWIYSSIGLLIVLIAAINFINLSTAHALKRSKEVGVKKVLGASNSLISRQFLFETFMLTFLATVLALILVEITLPSINSFLGQKHELSLYKSPNFIVYLLFLYVIISFLTGVYPAFVLAGFKPMNALKNIFNAPQKSSLYFRNSLVVLQFVISIVLIISTLTINRQIKYIDDFDMGFDVENVVLFTLPGNDEQSLNELTSLLSSDPGVISFTYATGAPYSEANFTTSFVPPGAAPDEKHDLNIKAIDTAYAGTFGLEVIAGRWLHKKHPKDSLFEIIVNEKFCRDYGFKTIDEAINKRVQLNFIDGHIKGVLKNFHLESLKRSIRPVAFIELRKFYLSVCIKLHPKRLSQTLDRIQHKMSEIYPENFISYEMYEDTLKEEYNSEQQTSSVITVLSFLAILISSLGLFGLVSFLIVQRLKEISVRKVLGASLTQNMGLLFRDYLKLVLLACILAIPIGWYIMDRWLSEFQYRISLSWWIFALAALMSLVLAMITILYHIIKSSNANPVDSLNVE